MLNSCSSLDFTVPCYASIWWWTVNICSVHVWRRASHILQKKICGGRPTINLKPVCMRSCPKVVVKSQRPHSTHFPTTMAVTWGFCHKHYINSTLHTKHSKGSDWSPTPSFSECTATGLYGFMTWLCHLTSLKGCCCNIILFSLVPRLPDLQWSIDLREPGK